MTTMGMFTAFAFFVFIMKLPAPIRRKALGLDITLDVAATILMMLAFAASGTYSGMSAAIVGGLIFSALLIVTKFLLGYETPHWNGQTKRFFWVFHRGVFSPRQRSNDITEI